MDILLGKSEDKGAQTKEELSLSAWENSRTLQTITQNR